LELRLVRSDGLSFWAHLATTITLDDNEMPVCRMALSDISERKRNEEALKLDK
jgi:PAS domain S-box-containing protein